MRPRFAGVHANQRVRCLVRFMEKCTDRAAYGMKRGVVQRWRSGNTADAIGAKKLFSHRKKERWLEPRSLGKILAQQANGSDARKIAVQEKKLYDTLRIHGSNPVIS